MKQNVYKRHTIVVYAPNRFSYTIKKYPYPNSLTTIAHAIAEAIEGHEVETILINGSPHKHCVWLRPGDIISVYTKEKDCGTQGCYTCQHNTFDVDSPCQRCEGEVKFVEKKEEKPKQCSSCVYYEHSTCRRNPPTTEPVFVSGWGRLSSWPGVKINDWCGEYKHP